MNAGAPTFRFFARSTSGLLPLLNIVNLVYRDNLLGLVPVHVELVVKKALGLAPHGADADRLRGRRGSLGGGEAPLSLRFTALSGTWQLDDVFVDPYARR